MKLSIKAAVFSGIVFPGAGYFVVEKMVQGVVFLLMTMSGLAVLFYEAYFKAQIIAERILRGEIMFDFNIIREQILILPSKFSPEVLSGISIFIGIIWLFGTIDAYRIGRLKETCSTL